jgi:hypothetical protein
MCQSCCVFRETWLRSGGEFRFSGCRAGSKETRERAYWGWLTDARARTKQAAMTASSGRTSCARFSTASPVRASAPTAPTGSARRASCGSCSARSAACRLRGRSRRRRSRSRSTRKQRRRMCVGQSLYGSAHVRTVDRWVRRLPDPAVADRLGGRPLRATKRRQQLSLTRPPRRPGRRARHLRGRLVRGRIPRSPGGSSPPDPAAAGAGRRSSCRP